MMKNYDELSEINQSSNWSYIPNHLYKILTNGSHCLSTGKKKVGIKELKKLKSIIDYLQAIDNVYEKKC